MQKNISQYLTSEIKHELCLREIYSIKKLENLIILKKATVYLVIKIIKLWSSS